VISTRDLPIARPEADKVLRAASAPDVDSAIDALVATNPTVRWGIAQGMWALGAPAPRAFLAAYLDYTLADGIAEKITCPTLVCDAGADIFFEGQPDAAFEHLTTPTKTFMRFLDSEGAGAHCHSGAQRLAFARIYDWLDEALDRL
jgi:hypothetical protein